MYFMVSVNAWPGGPFHCRFLTFGETSSGYSHITAAGGESGSSPPTGVSNDSRLGGLLPDNLVLMAQHHRNDPDLDGYVDWVVFDRAWGVFSEDLPNLEEARELPGRTGGGPVFRRQWAREFETD